MERVVRLLNAAIARKDLNAKWAKRISLECAEVQAAINNIHKAAEKAKREAEKAQVCCCHDASEMLLRWIVARALFVYGQLFPCTATAC